MNLSSACSHAHNIKKPDIIIAGLSPLNIFIIIERARLHDLLHFTF